MSSSTPAVKVSSGTRPHDDSPRMLSDGSGASRATSKPDAAGSATNDTPNPQDVSSNAHQGRRLYVLGFPWHASITYPYTLSVLSPPRTVLDQLGLMRIPAFVAGCASLPAITTLSRILGTPPRGT